MNGRIEFIKMHGAGNDFILINDPEGKFSDTEGLVAALCKPHRGIGADGMILIKPSRTFDFSMKYFNRDGGEAEMCGNGARCAAMFAFRSGMTNREMNFETSCGSVKADILEHGVRIDIGGVGKLELDMRLRGVGGNLHFALAGVPHAVLLTDDARNTGDNEFLRLARSVRYHEKFKPAGTNFDFVTVRDRHELIYRTYERGVEMETLACGTGAAAAAVITTHLGLTGSPVTCETSGKEKMEVDFEKTDCGAVHCRLTGPVVETFRGTFAIGDYV